MNIEVRDSARFSREPIFLSIAIDCYIRLRKKFIELETLKTQGEFVDECKDINGNIVNVTRYANQFEVVNAEFEVDKEIVQIIISISIFLESYIWNLSAITLGDSYTQKHLEKLDLESKWTIIPKLITGVEIDKSKSYFASFKKLITLRNKFVHYKSKNQEPILERGHYGEKEIIDFFPLNESINVKEFFELVLRLLTELDRIDPNRRHLSRYVDSLKDVLNTE